MTTQAHYMDLHDEAWSAINKATGFYELMKADALGKKNFHLMGELVDAGRAPIHLVISIGHDINKAIDNKLITLLN